MATEVRAALHIHGEQITSPVSPAVQNALNEWNEGHLAELIEVLAPFGLHPYDLAQPEYRAIVYL